MAAFDDLVKEVSDENLRAQLLSTYAQATRGRTFGLVYENHIPEATPMPGVPIRVGMTVATRQQDGGALYQVAAIEKNQAICLPVGRARAPREPSATIQFPLADLVAVARFGEPIYPTLKPIAALEHGGGDLWHTLIQADNYHALQLLEYLYPGQVDCIYIDPPYNTGAKDWKYNNDYVDSSDAYRHSKWLSMMEKRLAIAKRLLNPKDSVMIVTIDEKEYLHLGMLLEQMFPEARIQMVSSVINPKGSVKDGQFTRCEEYLYFVCLGGSQIQGGSKDFLFESVKKEVRWPSLKRTGTHSMRTDRPNLFYPIFYNKATGRFVSVGEALPISVKRDSVSIPEGLMAVWPLDEHGGERVWQLGPETLKDIASKGYVRFGLIRNGTASPYYISQGLREQIASGEIVVVSTDENGAVELEYASGVRAVQPKTIWNVTIHSASEHGTKLIASIIGDKKFSFPKSLYAVKDSIRCVVANKPNALIVDFFAGSGTTLHAVNLLNAEDGGHRRCILVTNNEVSNDEAAAFRKKGLRPGDEEWEAKGIAQYVTWPRTVCSIKGVNVKGEALKGEYITSGVRGAPALPMSEGFKANAAFFKLGFTSREAVAMGLDFAAMLPVIWMKSGAVGKCPEVGNDALPEMLVLPENRFAVLLDSAAFVDFRKAVKADKRIRDVYFVEDDEEAYSEMASRFAKYNTYRLFGDYVDHFVMSARRNG